MTPNITYQPAPITPTPQPKPEVIVLPPDFHSAVSEGKIIAKA
jgi:hypothetical protein